MSCGESSHLSGKCAPTLIYTALQLYSAHKIQQYTSLLRLCNLAWGWVGGYFPASQRGVLSWIKGGDGIAVEIHLCVAKWKYIFVAGGQNRKAVLASLNIFPPPFLSNIVVEVQEQHWT